MNSTVDPVENGRQTPAALFLADLSGGKGIAVLSVVDWSELRLSECVRIAAGSGDDESRCESKRDTPELRRGCCKLFAPMESEDKSARV